MLDSISSEELTEWAAYYQIDPFGSHRADLQAGVVASTMANIHAKKGHTFTPSDFMPTFGKEKQETGMSPQQIHAMITKTFGSRQHG